MNCFDCYDSELQCTQMDIRSLQVFLSGLGIAFISKFAVATELKARTLVAVRVTGLNIKRELKVVYRKDKHLGNAARTFIEMAKKQRV